MITTILYVEADPELAEMVRLSFEDFGYRGTSLSAPTVAEARRILLDDKRFPRLDLTITDMELPDGSGLDVIHCVRTSPVREHVPVLVVSGETSRDEADRAYALGATSYIASWPRGRPMHQIVRALYDHWFQDALLPRRTPRSRTYRLLARAVQIRTRHANTYMQLAALRHEREDAAFWMTLALKQGNLANLLAFLQQQLDAHALPAPLLDELESIQRAEVRVLDHVERLLAAHRVRTREDAGRVLIALVSNFDARPFARSIGSMFPVGPVAIRALRDVAARGIDDIASWLEAHATEPASRDRARQLRADAAYLRAEPEPAAEPPGTTILA